MQPQKSWEIYISFSTMIECIIFDGIFQFQNHSKNIFKIHFILVTMMRPHPSEELFLSTLERKGYVLGGLIGKGGTATCYLVTSKKYNNQEFVCKRIKVNEKSLCNHCELEALQQLNSLDIILLYDFEITPEEIYLFLEYCPGGTIGQLVNSQGPLTGKNLLGVMKNLLVALNEIHKQRFAHLDIKPANILIDRYGRPKYADFGISRLFPEQFQKSKHFVGTLPYLSPEILLGSPHDPFKADIYALGITFYYLVYGMLPWNSQRTTSLKDEIIKIGVQIPQDCPQPIKILIINMTAIDPENRPSAQDILTLPLFRGIERNDGFIRQTKRVTIGPHSTESTINREGSEESLGNPHIHKFSSNPSFLSLSLMNVSIAPKLIQSTPNFNDPNVAEARPQANLLRRKLATRKIKASSYIITTNTQKSASVKPAHKLISPTTFSEC